MASRQREIIFNLGLLLSIFLCLSIFLYVSLCIRYNEDKKDINGIVTRQREREFSIWGYNFLSLCLCLSFCMSLDVFDTIKTRKIWIGWFQERERGKFQFGTIMFHLSVSVYLSVCISLYSVQWRQERYKRMVRR